MRIEDLHLRQVVVEQIRRIERSPRGLGEPTAARLADQASLSMLTRALAHRPERQHRVAELQKQIQQGSYRPDPAAISKKLIDEALTLGPSS